MYTVVQGFFERAKGLPRADRAIGTTLYTVERNDDAKAWEVFEAVVLPDVRHATQGTRKGHARVRNTKDVADVWDVPFSNMDAQRAEAQKRCDLSNGNSSAA